MNPVWRSSNIFQLLCKCKCIQSFVERRLQGDQRPFTSYATHHIQRILNHNIQASSIATLVYETIHSPARIISCSLLEAKPPPPLLSRSEGLKGRSMPCHRVLERRITCICTYILTYIYIHTHILLEQRQIQLCYQRITNSYYQYTHRSPDTEQSLSYCHVIYHASRHLCLSKLLLCQSSLCTPLCQVVAVNMIYN